MNTTDAINSESHDAIYDCLTFDISSDLHPYSISSVDFALPLLLDQLEKITREWITSKSIDNRCLIRFQVSFVVDCEAEASLSQALLSNISNNNTILTEQSRLVYVSPGKDNGIAGYGLATSFPSLQSFTLMSHHQFMSKQIWIIGGDRFFHHHNEVAFAGSSASSNHNWVIPAIEIRVQSWPRSILAVNINVADLESQLRNAKVLLRNLNFEMRLSPSTRSRVPPLVRQMSDTGMTEAEYIDAVQSSLLAMERCELRKVVFALKRTGMSPCQIDAAALLLAVADGNNSDQSKRYTFLFAPNGCVGEIFISLTPEKLCSVENAYLSTEALAGTFPKSYIDSGGTIDDKTCREHGAVTNYIIDKLQSEQVCSIEQIKVESRELLIMKDVVHFRQRISAQASSARGPQLLAQVVKCLHPTPAVCGLPVDVAMNLIKSREKFDRGLYGSYCGVVTSSGGELMVALRSATVNGNKVDVYAGAGLVPGSKAVDEWNEIQLKMSQYVRILTSVQRPAMSTKSPTAVPSSDKVAMAMVKDVELPNATSVVAAMVIEEMIRCGVEAFCVCPGSRSTPFAVAIHRNSVARMMTQVIHDERSAGFYALGCAKAGILCAVLVTSGTAVSNLLPAMSEARESGYPIVLITADRPYEKRDVGEAQTIKQFGMFSGLVGFEKDYPAPDSEAPKSTSQLINGIVADISFAIAQVAKQKAQRVHLNFQIRKSEIDPEIILGSESFYPLFCAVLNFKMLRWCSSLSPYTTHCNLNQFLRTSLVSSRLARWVDSEHTIWSVIVVAGELRTGKDAISLSWMCQQLRIPCVVDKCSLLKFQEFSDKTDCMFVNVDRLLNSNIFAETLRASVRVVLRVGGSVISARTHDWVTQCSDSGAVVVRVRDDGADSCRHDPSWVADYYVHSSVSAFCDQLTLNLGAAQFQVRPAHEAQKDIGVRNNLVNKTNSQYQNNQRSSIVSPALLILRLATQALLAQSKQLLATESDGALLNIQETWAEPQIAMVLQQEFDETTPVFLSSSMPCRDFDSFTPSFDSAVATQTKSSEMGFRRVGCNRGGNGIDGVISSAVGYAYGCAASRKPLVLLIGDIATLHDISAIALAAGTSPGNVLTYMNAELTPGRIQGKIGKIVCVNNSGGAIFSFLPAAKYRAPGGFFTPFLDTPHNLCLTDIAKGLCGISSTTAVQVSNIQELRHALRNENVLFIECVCLPTHTDNLALHKSINQSLVLSVDSLLLKNVAKNLTWSFVASNEQSMSTLPLMVVMHGWLGSSDDWSPLLQHMHGFCGILKVSTDSDVLSATLLCHALRKVITETVGHYFNGKSGPQLVFIGYSQGGRLAMHYRSLFPNDVHTLITLSSCPIKDKVVSAEFELWVLELARKHHEMKDFLSAWYSEVPVFCNLRFRMPLKFQTLLQRRQLEDKFVLVKSLRNMVCLSATNDAPVDVTLVGELDVKYVSMACEGQTLGAVQQIVRLPASGHALLVECESDTLAAMIDEHIIKMQNVQVRNLITSRIINFIVKPFSVSLESPLVVQTNGRVKTFTSRKGYRLLAKVEKCDSSSNRDIPVTSISWGVGEIYEPVFTTPNTPYDDPAYYEVDMKKSIMSATKLLENHVCDVGQGSEKDVAAAVRDAVTDLHGSTEPWIVYGLEQCLLHALSRSLNCSLIVALAAYINSNIIYSDVYINDFATSIRSRQQQTGQPHTTYNSYRQIPVLKMKIGDLNGDFAESDAIRTNDLVDSVLSVGSNELEEQTTRSNWLRLDANRSWSLQQAIAFGSALTAKSIRAIDYVEEPLRVDTSASMELVGNSQTRCEMFRELRMQCKNWCDISIALDETLADSTVATFEAIEKTLQSDVASIGSIRCVYKPSLLSLSHPALRRSGESDTIPVTISCTFESGVGLAFLVCLAACLDNTNMNSSHGIHALPDMVKSDLWTAKFHDIESQTDMPNRSVKVSAALQLIDEFLQSESEILN